MWVEDIRDVSIELEQDGVVVVKEEDKAIISSSGPWATVVFLYREWEEERQAYGPLKVSLRKYRKHLGGYKQESKFNIASLGQALAIAQVFREWAQRYGEGEGEASGGP